MPDRSDKMGRFSIQEDAGLKKVRRWLWVPPLAAVLVFVAYGWALTLPFIGDDYLQITLGRQYGSPGSWADLAADPPRCVVLEDCSS